MRNELESVINKHSMEIGSRTPDYILADYLMACLKAFDLATTKRDSWYGYNNSQSKEVETKCLQP